MSETNDTPPTMANLDFPQVATTDVDETDVVLIESEDHESDDEIELALAEVEARVDADDARADAHADADPAAEAVIEVGLIDMVRLDHIDEDSRVRHEMWTDGLVELDMTDKSYRRVIHYQHFRRSVMITNNLWKQFVAMNETLERITIPQRRKLLEEKCQNIGRKLNRVVTLLRMRFAVPPDIVPNVIRPRGSGNVSASSQKTRPASVVHTTEEMTIPVPDIKFLEAINDEIKSNTDRASLLKAGKMRIAIAKLNNLALSLTETKTLYEGAHGERKNMHLRKFIKLGHDYNAHAQSMKVLFGLNKESESDDERSAKIRCILSNARKGHGESAKCIRNDVKERQWCGAMAMDQFDPEDLVVYHNSRRNTCTGSKEFLETSMVSYLESNSKLGKSSEAVSFGTNHRVKYGGMTQNAVLIKCGCISMRTNKASCDTMMWAEEPALLSKLAEYGTDMDKWKTIVENRRVTLLREKYGNEVFAYCPNTTCSMSHTGFIVNEVLAHLEGHGPKTTTRRECIECATVWCTSCSMSPFHERKPCPGPAYALAKDEDGKPLEGEALWTFLQENKACPFCNALTSRTDGCNHMTCGSCQKHWCWRCGGKRHQEQGRWYSHTCPIGIDYDVPQHITDAPE